MSEEEIWYRLEMLTENPDQESAWIWEDGAAGIEVQDETTFMEDGGIPETPPGLTRLIAFFSAASDDTPLPERLMGREHVLWERYDDTSWATAWQKYFKPVQMSDRVIVGPPWEDFSAPEGGIRVEILPGMAFGTGTHETTQLCAGRIDHWLQNEAWHADTTMLDVGCGTAILSIIARKLGLQRITGIDLDDDVMQVARENAETNGVVDLDLSTTPLNEVGGDFDLVVANILAHILMNLRDDLVARTKTGGTLMCCGITTAQRDDFFAHFTLPELELVHEQVLGEWVLFQWRKVAA